MPVCVCVCFVYGVWHKAFSAQRMVFIAYSVLRVAYNVRLVRYDVCFMMCTAFMTKSLGFTFYVLGACRRRDAQPICVGGAKQAYHSKPQTQLAPMLAWPLFAMTGLMARGSAKGG